VLGTTELLEEDHQSLTVKEEKEEKASAVGAQSSVPAGVTESDVTTPEECQRAGPTQVQSKPLMLDGKSFH